MPDLQVAETPKKRVIMTDAEMRILESMGWDFVPRGKDYDEVSRQAAAACFD